jgi:hypothetical protein
MEMKVRKVEKERVFQGYRAKSVNLQGALVWRLHGDSNPGYSRERGLPTLVSTRTYTDTSPLCHHSSKLDYIEQLHDASNNPKFIIGVCAFAAAYFGLSTYLN